MITYVVKKVEITPKEEKEKKKEKKLEVLHDP